MTDWKTLRGLVREHPELGPLIKPAVDQRAEELAIEHPVIWRTVALYVKVERAVMATLRNLRDTRR